MEMLLLEHAGRRYAVEAAWVGEIVESAPLTPLPFAPDWVEGLAGIADAVLVQIDLGRRLGLSAPAGSGSLLVLQVGCERLAVRVDRVIAKLELPPEAFAPNDAEDGEAVFVAGEFAWEGEVVLCLAAAAFSLADLELLEGSGADSRRRGEEREKDDPAAEEAFCLFFRSSTETYALPLAEVAEVVAGQSLTPVPQAPAEVAGMLLLRGAPLLVLSLSVLLGRPEPGPAATLAVVEHEGIRLALGVGPVLGIERFAASELHALPQQDTGLQGFVVSPWYGMSGLVALAALLSPERLAEYGKFMAREARETGPQAADSGGNAGGKLIRLLTFRAGSERCALPLDWVQRVAAAEDEADGGRSDVALIGGEVLPVVDLAGALDQCPAGRHAGTPAYLVVNAENGTWALKVDRVERVVNLHERDIEPVRADAGSWIGAVGKLDGQLLSIVHLEPLRQAA